LRYLLLLTLLACDRSPPTTSVDPDPSDSGVPSESEDSGDSGHSQDSEYDPDVLDPDMVDPRWLQVGTYNAEWLSNAYGPNDPSGYVPRNQVDYEQIASLLTSIDVDILAMEELYGSGALHLLNLPRVWEFEVGTTGGSRQRLGLLYRSDKVSVHDVREVHLDANISNGYKDPLVAEVRSLEGGWEITAIVVHMKAFSDAESVDRRAMQIEDLNEWLLTATDPGGDPVIHQAVIIGDLNDTVEGIGYKPTLKPLLDNPDLFFVSEQCSGGTVIGWESRIDHVVFSTRLAPRHRTDDGGCHITRHDDLSPWNDYAGGYNNTQNISDHRPIWTYLWQEMPSSAP